MVMPRRLGNKILQLYQQGKNRHEIEELTGASCEYVRDVLVREYGDLERKRKVRVNPRLITDMYQKGFACVTIAKELGICIDTACSIVREHLGIDRLSTVTRRPRKRKKPKKPKKKVKPKRDMSKDQLILKEYLAGTPIGKIPASCKTVEKVRVFYNLPPRRLRTAEMQKRNCEIIRLVAKYQNKNLVAKRLGISWRIVDYVIKTRRNIHDNDKKSLG